MAPNFSVCLDTTEAPKESSSYLPRIQPPEGTKLLSKLVSLVGTGVMRVTVSAKFNYFFDRSASPVLLFGPLGDDIGVQETLDAGNIAQRMPLRFSQRWIAI